nr:MAG TPA: hypothetical protein [Caudoviricetes sp.]
MHREITKFLLRFSVCFCLLIKLILCNQIHLVA